MVINKQQEGNVVNIALEGRLDTVSTPELEAALAGLAPDANVTFDFAKLEYISSSGLRVVLATQKTVNAAGKLVIKNVNDTIMEVFEITGFADILTIE